MVKYEERAVVVHRNFLGVLPVVCLALSLLFFVEIGLVCYILELYLWIMVLLSLYLLTSFVVGKILAVVGLFIYR